MHRSILEGLVDTESLNSVDDVIRELVHAQHLVAVYDDLLRHMDSLLATDTSPAEEELSVPNCLEPVVGPETLELVVTDLLEARELFVARQHAVRAMNVKPKKKRVRKSNGQETEET